MDYQGRNAMNAMMRNALHTFRRADIG